MDIRGWHILSTLGVGSQPKDQALCRACIHIAVIERVFSRSGKYDARLSLMDVETKKRLYLPDIEGYWEQMGIKIPMWFSQFQDMLERLEAKYATSLSIEVPIPGMSCIVLCVDDKNSKLERCAVCKTSYKCTVNARRCEVSHPLMGKAKAKAKRVMVPSSMPIDSAGMAEFWDNLPMKERLDFVGDSWEPNTNAFVETDGKLLVATIDMICEGTHLLFELRKPGFMSEMMLTADDQIAKRVHTFAGELITAYTASQEKKLLDLLDVEKKEKDEDQKKREARKYGKYLKRLEQDIFKNKPSTTVAWWEDEY